MLNFRSCLFAGFLFLTLLLSSCTKSNRPDTYPTYDPFAPVNGTGAQVTLAPGSDVMQPLRTPLGSTPTRAPLTVNVPAHNSSSSSTTPTPDQPHPIPTARDVLDQYTVQPGDTLGSIAQGYGITLESLMQANSLDESSILMVGTVLDIPPVEVDPNPGSSFKLIPDSELVYGPASAQFDVDSFIDEHAGYLAEYSQDVDGQTLTGAQIIELVSQNYSVNPRLLLALLEYRSGWVTDAEPQNVDYPLGFYDSYYAGLYRQLAWTANNLNRGYYLWRVNALSTLPLSDGTYVPLDPTINAGTAGVQYFLSLFNNRPFWDNDVSKLGLFDAYNKLFGYPFDYDIPSLVPVNPTQPAMQLPFEEGVVWSFTGGPHGGWDSGSAWAALDFAPRSEEHTSELQSPC